MFSRSTLHHVYIDTFLLNLKIMFFSIMFRRTSDLFKSVNKINVTKICLVISHSSVSDPSNDFIEYGCYEWSFFFFTDCTIISITSPTASSLLVQWNRIQGASNYFLDLRVANDSISRPVVTSVPGSLSMKEVFGLKTGTLYAVTLKGFQLYTPVCLDTKLARTGNLLLKLIFFFFNV